MLLALPACGGSVQPPSSTTAAGTPEPPAEAAQASPRGPGSAGPASDAPASMKTAAEASSPAPAVALSHAKGRTTCVIPSDDRGLTHEVEECMSERIARELQPADADYELPVRITDGKVELAETKAAPVLASVETHGLSGASTVVQGLMPELRACIQKGAGASTGLRVLYVGARVGRDGHVACSATTAAESVPPAVRDCTSAVLAKATFAPPTEKVGLVSIPLKLLASH